MRTAKGWLSAALGAALVTSARAEPARNTAVATAAATAPSTGAAASAPASADEPGDPTLEETQAAAARLAAGDEAEDASRRSRARASHWAPVARGQVGGTANDRTRDGTQYAQPVHLTDLGGATSWSVSLTWDLPSAIYARDENQLALSAVHLARVRREVSVRAAQLYGARQRQRIALREQSGPAQQLDAALALLETTAELDQLTGGLFRPALARAQARFDLLSHSRLHEESP